MDLEQVRLQLNKMTDRILMRFHDRSGFPQNPSVYKRGARPDRAGDGQSLLEFALAGMEAYHASLGRFDHPDQFPIMSDQFLDAPARRRPAGVAAPGVRLLTRDDLLAFYVDQVLPRLCPPGDDRNTHGETAYVDADLLQLINERINIGRAVAAAKAASDPSTWDALDDTPALVAKLRDFTRERRVLEDVEERARRYDIAPGVARFIFEWIIEKTIDVEVAYLRAAAAEREGA